MLVECHGRLGSDNFDFQIASSQWPCHFWALSEHVDLQLHNMTTHMVHTHTHGMLPLGCQWKVGKTVRPWRRAQGSSHSGRFWQVLRLLEKIHSVEVQFKSSNAGAMLPHGIYGILGNLLRIFGWYVPWNPFFFPWAWPMENLVREMFHSFSPPSQATAKELSELRPQSCRTSPWS